MNSAVIGGVLGGLAATGVVIAVRGLPAMRPIRLQDRIAPYNRNHTVNETLKSID